MQFNSNNLTTIIDTLTTNKLIIKYYTVINRSASDLRVVNGFVECVDGVINNIREVSFMQMFR